MAQSLELFTEKCLEIPIENVNGKSTSRTKAGKKVCGHCCSPQHKKNVFKVSCVTFPKAMPSDWLADLRVSFP